MLAFVMKRRSLAGFAGVLLVIVAAWSLTDTSAQQRRVGLIVTPVVSCEASDVLKVSAVNQGPVLAITMSLLRLDKSGQLVEFESSGPRPLGSGASSLMANARMAMRWWLAGESRHRDDSKHLFSGTHPYRVA